MKALTKKEMRAVNGGSWKCKNCGEKFWLFILGVTHQNCEAHYDGLSFCW